MSDHGLLIEEITRIAADLSGYEPDELDSENTFLQLGFDSLFLTQLATIISNRFETQVTFRSLFAEHPSIAELAVHLDGVMPDTLRSEFEAASDGQPEPLPEAGSEDVPAPAINPAPVALSGTMSRIPMADQALGSLLTEQLELMVRQLELLSGHAQSAGQAAAVSAKDATIKSGKADTTSAEVQEPPVELPAGFGPGTTRKDTATLTEGQRAHLDELVVQYNLRTPGSKDSAQRYRQWHADPRTASGFNPLWKEMVYPIVVNQSKGSRLWDVDGNEYIDLLNGFGPNFLGHSPDFITDGLIEQLRSGVEIGPQTPLAGETARMICEFSGMDRATFVNTGSEAVQAAMRVARTITGRDGVVVFSGDYHGNFDEVLVRAVGKPDQPRTMPMAPGIPRSSVSEVRVLPYGEDHALKLIEDDARQLAAVVVEPIQSRRPELQPREFLHRLRELTREHGILLIFDEVITGFRCQPGGAQAFYDVDADLVTFGKIVGGGMPIGVVAGRAHIMDTFDGGFWNYGDDSFPEAGVTFFAGTFIRHPLTIKATYETVRYLLEQGPEVYARVNASAEWLCTRLNALFERYQVAAEVPFCNSQIFVRMKEAHPLAGLFFYHLRLRGIYIQEGFPCYLTDAHTREDLEQVLQAFEESITVMVDAGIFSESAAQSDAKTESLEPSSTLATASGSPTAEPVNAQCADPEFLQAEPEEAFALTDSQMEIWLDVAAMDQAACAYNESDTLRLSGPLNADRLRQCLDKVVGSHAAFRLRFADQQQSLAAASGFKTTFLDLSKDEADPAYRLQELRRSMGRTAFDLENGPVCSAVLVQTGPAEHYLLFGAHHLVYDGWSADVLLEQLATLYAQAGEPGTIAVPGFHTVLSRLESPEVRDLREQSTAYWVEKLGECVPETLELPTDRPRPPTWDFSGDTLSHTIDAALVERLRDAASRRGVTMYALTLAAFRVIIARLTNNKRFAIGTSVSSQPLLQLPEVIGNGVNFIPVPVAVELETSLADFLDLAMDDVFSISENPLTTLGQLVQRVKCSRDLSRPVLAQAVFNYAPERAGIRFPGLGVNREENARSFVHFDLFANLTETGGGIAMDWDYPTALFDRSTVQRWMACYERLLEAIADRLENDAAQEAIAGLEWVPSAERQQVLHEFNDTTRPVPEASVIETITAQAAATPEALAVCFGDRSLTYAELNQSANVLAARMVAELGAPGTQAVVGLAMGRSEQIVIAILAAWKAGYAYLPLDPGFPRSRLSYMAEDAGVALLLVEQAQDSPMDFSGPKLVVDADVPAPEIAQPLPEVAAELAYIIYTSGSTGAPKGVCIGHTQVRNLLHSMAREPGLEAEDTLLAVTTLSFDISILEILLPLTVGATLNVASADDLADGEAFIRLIGRSGAKALQATPSTWRMLLDAGWTGNSDLKALCGGEPLPLDLARSLIPLVGSLWNLYGPTETTVWSSCCQIRAEHDRIIVGQPIDNTRIYVLDQFRQPVPRGVTGELFIGGAGVAEGYHDREELTRERFMDDPWSPEPGARMYRTGDLGRFLPDGQIEHLGRVDNQVKVRGFRIELGEIEACLNEQPGIEQAVAKVFELAPGDQRLVAFLVAKDDQRPSTIKLRKALRQNLPDYMIPQHFEQIGKLPLTPNGKVDRAALTTPEAFVTASLAGAPPSSEIEKTVAGIWAELLDVSGLTTADNFFELGGHSLLAMRAIQQMASALGRRLPPQVLVMNSLGEVADILEEQTTAAADNQGERQGA